MRLERKVKTGTKEKKRAGRKFLIVGKIRLTGSIGEEEADGENGKG